MFEQFKTRAEAVSAEVHHFPTKTGALEFILQLLHTEGIADAMQSYAVWADCRFLTGIDRKKLAEKVPGLRFDVTREVASESRIGITQMDWAIANTGTLAQDSVQVEQRLASSLPSIHLALVGTDKLLADLPSFLNKMSPRESGSIAMITGPSRTADIERVLTIGVHGPERLIIVFVDELDERDD
jgi:L-lactate dehydrogenase complex protein LldG